jgi:iron complex transport system substrate-binding protein
MTKRADPRGSALCLGALLLGALLACRSSVAVGDAGSVASGRHRIVCLTPSSTELVAALGAAGEIVGVDKYSSYPDEVAHLPRVGDFLSPDMEAILALHPDIAVLDAVQDKVAAKLQAAGITAVSLEMQTVEDVRKGLVRLGSAIGRATEAEQALARLDAALQSAGDLAARRRAAGSKAPRVLFVVDRQAGSLAGLVAAGPGTYLDELLTLLGAQNVLMYSSVRYSNLSAEDVITFAPDIILDAAHTEDAARAVADWQALSSVPAVAAGRVHVLADPAVIAPGPRLGAVLARLAPLIWP